MKSKKEQHFVLKWRRRSDPKMEYHTQCTTRQLADEFIKMLKREGLLSLKLECVQSTHERGPFTTEISI